MGNLLKHAQAEMKRAGLYDKDTDYAGMIPENVEEMVKAFESAGHSGGSRMLTLSIFDKVARFQTLSPITDDPSEWMDVSEHGPCPMWQSRRNPALFSTDGGKTHYSVNDPKRIPKPSAPHKN